MSPNDVLESYVRDVAANLPGKMRSEVADDLRGQLADELMGRAEAAGRAPDEALALQLVRDFGRPEQLAAKYYTPFSIIDPADTRRFVIVAVIGWGLLATIVVTLRRFGLESADSYDAGILTWIGILTVIFGFRTWMIRQDPGKYLWKPRKFVDIERAHPLGLLCDFLGTAILLAVYMWPGPAVELVTSGRIAAERLAYHPEFTGAEYLRMPWLGGILVLKLALLAWVAIHVRWTRIPRLAALAINLHIALQLGWHMAYGKVFVDPQMERIAFIVVSAMVFGIGVDLMVRSYREWNWVGRHRLAPAA